MQNELSRSQLVFRGITSTAKGNRAGDARSEFHMSTKGTNGKKGRMTL